MADVLERVDDPRAQQAEQPGALSPASQAGVGENPGQQRPAEDGPVGDAAVVDGAGPGLLQAQACPPGAANVSQPVQYAGAEPVLETLHWLPLTQPPAEAVAEVLLWCDAPEHGPEWQHFVAGAWQDGEFMLADGDPLPAGWPISHYAVVRGPRACA